MCDSFYGLAFEQNKKLYYLDGSGHKDNQPDSYSFFTNPNDIQNFCFSSKDKAQEMLDWVKSNIEEDDFTDIEYKSGKTRYEIINNVKVYSI